MYIELVLGFSATEYEVHENDESVMIEIFVHGIPGGYQPVVLISTCNGTATGQISPSRMWQTIINFFQ